MVIVKIKHGLGNQLFQYALGRSLARRFDTELVLDTSYYTSPAVFIAPAFRSYQLDQFKISARVLGPGATRWMDRLNGRKLTPVRIAAKAAGIIRIVEDKECGFDESVLRKAMIVYLDGYWQTERYFADVRETLLAELSLREPASPEISPMLARINAETSVCVHVRRGDYVSTAFGRNNFVSCGLDYYKAAMAYIGAKVPNAKFYLFSDDPAWVQANFPAAENLVIVSGNASHGDLEDFRLMMNCRHFIIANSSFSWWTAWLGKHQDKIIIAPKQWHHSRELLTKEIVPPHWIRL